MIRDRFAAPATISRSSFWMAGRCWAAAADFLGRCDFFFVATDVDDSFVDWTDALASGAGLIALALVLDAAPVVADFCLLRRFLIAPALAFSEASFSASWAGHGGTRRTMLQGADFLRRASG